MQRLGVFALVSEIPYDLTFHGKLLDLERQNIFFTLLLGVILLNLLESGGQWLLQAAKVLFMMWIAEVFKVDYGYEGNICGLRQQEAYCGISSGRTVSRPSAGLPYCRFCCITVSAEGR